MQLVWFERIRVTLSSENARLLFYNGGQRDLLGKTIMYLNWQLNHSYSSKMKCETFFVLSRCIGMSWFMNEEGKTTTYTSSVHIFCHPYCVLVLSVKPPLTFTDIVLIWWCMDSVLIWIIQTPRVRFLQRHKKRKLCWFFSVSSRCCLMVQGLDQQPATTWAPSTSKLC